MASVVELVAYYANLLILQYHDLPKATATVELIAETILGDGLIIDVEQAYNLDTAIGKQLDVLGKYIGATRFFSERELTDYFGYVVYADYLSLPTSPPVFGLCLYSGWGNPSYNGTLSYYDNPVVNNTLSDDDYRALLKYLARLNTINFSAQAIDQIMWDTFGALIRPETNNRMQIVYFMGSPLTTMIYAMIAKKLLPQPMGVLVLAVKDVNGLMFGFTDYSDYESPFAYGFSTYANYGTLAGDVLTYPQITVQ